MKKAIGKGRLIGVVVAPDLEEAGELAETIEALVKECETSKPKVTVVFALSRARLSYALRRGTRGASVAGIIHVEGQQREWREVCKLSEKQRQAWRVAKLAQHEF